MRRSCGTGAADTAPISRLTEGARTVQRHRASDRSRRARSECRRLPARSLTLFSSPAGGRGTGQYLTSSKIEKSRAVQEGYLPTLTQLYSDAEVLKAVPEAAVFANPEGRIGLQGPLRLRLRSIPPCPKIITRRCTGFLLANRRPRRRWMTSSGSLWI